MPRAADPSSKSAGRRPAPADAVAEVVEQIKRRIRSGAMKPGDKLPSEIGLAGELGLSRSAVTKAYARLEAFGLIRTVPQSGAYLAEIGGDALSELVANALEASPAAAASDDLDLLYRLRATVEETLAVWAAETASDAQLKRLAKKAATVKKKILEGGGGIDDDLTFHMEIAELSGKPFFKSLLFFVTLPMVRAFRAFEAEKPAAVLRKRWTASMAEHDAIVAAIQARDAKRVRRAVARHFERSIAFRS